MHTFACGFVHLKITRNHESESLCNRKSRTGNEDDENDAAQKLVASIPKVEKYGTKLEIAAMFIVMQLHTATHVDVL